jgi:hypothetical protein
LAVAANAHDKAVPLGFEVTQHLHRCGTRPAGVIAQVVDYMVPFDGNAEKIIRNNRAG